jgi:hypothetical protein
LLVNYRESRPPDFGVHPRNETQTPDDKPVIVILSRLAEDRASKG